MAYISPAKLTIALSFALSCTGLVSLELLDAKKNTPPKIGKVNIQKKWVFFNKLSYSRNNLMASTIPACLVRVFCCPSIHRRTWSPYMCRFQYNLYKWSCCNCLDKKANSTPLLNPTTGVQNPSELAAVVSFRDDYIKWEGIEVNWRTRSL